MRYIVMCRVSGGVTGTRQSELKKDGQIQIFDQREEAEQRAVELTTKLNSDPYRTAAFQYWVEEY